MASRAHPVLQKRSALGAGVVLLLMLLALWPALGTEPPPDAEAGTAAAAAVDPPVAASSRDAPRVATPAAPPVEVPAEPAPPADLSLPHRFEFELRVVDAFGLPVPDAHLFVAPEQCGFGLAPEPTDLRGRATFACRGRTLTLGLWVLVLARGIVESVRFVTLQADEPAVLCCTARGAVPESTDLEKWLAAAASEDLRLRLHQQIQQQRSRKERAQRRGRLLRRDELDVLCGRSIFLFAAMDCIQCHVQTRVQAYRPLEFAADLLPGMHPASRFLDLRARAPGLEERRKRFRELQAPAAADWRQRMVRQHGGTLGTVAGRVTTADGAPPGVVPVAWLDELGGLRYRSETDAAGAYAIDVPAGRPCRLVAGGGADGRAEATVVAVPGGRVDRDFVLEQPLCLRGRASDERGDPLVGWRVTFQGDPEPGAALAETREDGSFAMTLETLRGECLLWPPDADLRLPVVASGLVTAGAAEVDLQLPHDPPTRARLRLRVGLPPGHEHERVEMRVLQTATGRATHMSVGRFDDAFDLEGLPAGSYRGEVGTPGLGWAAFGPVHLDGRGLWDVGTVFLPRPGLLRVEVGHGVSVPFTGVWSIWRQGPATDVRVDAEPRGDRVPLPPGDYALLWIDEGRERSVAFSIVAGHETAIALR